MRTPVSCERRDDAGHRIDAPNPVVLPVSKKEVAFGVKSDPPGIDVRSCRRASVAVISTAVPARDPQWSFCSQARRRRAGCRRRCGTPPPSRIPEQSPERPSTPYRDEFIRQEESILDMPSSEGILHLAQRNFIWQDRGGLKTTCDFGIFRTPGLTVLSDPAPIHSVKT